MSWLGVDANPGPLFRGEGESLIASGVFFCGVYMEGPLWWGLRLATCRAAIRVG